MNAAEVHRACHDYLLARGWRREEPGSGWYWPPDGGGDLRLGEAVAEQLDRDGIDTRRDPASGFKLLPPGSTWYCGRGYNHEGHEWRYGVGGPLYSCTGVMPS